MSVINVDQVRALAKIFQQQDHMDQQFKKFKTKYKNYFHYDQPANVLQKVTKINQKINIKTSGSDEEKGPEKSQAFAFGELKVFTWVLTVYCHQNKLLLESMTEQHIKCVQNIFSHRSVTFLRYEIMCLAHEKAKFEQEWSQSEIEMLTKIVNAKENLCEWRQISYQLFCESEGKFYRPFQQCRQKWFNHLDPKVRKGKWTIEEDIALLTAIQCLDCKWIEICRELGGVRTEHMIKNRYKSLLKKWKKKYEKTSPTKIVSLVLKHLKNKLKKGDLNSSMSSNQHEEVPVPKKPKKGKQSNTSNSDKVESASVSVSRSNEHSSEESSYFGSSSSGGSGPSFKNDPPAPAESNPESSEFDLGMESNFNWRPNMDMNIDIGVQSLEERFQNAMVIGEEEFNNGEARHKQQRKTADSDEFLEDNHENNIRDFYDQLQPLGPLNNDMFEVEGFADLEDMRMRIIEQPDDGEWLYWDEKMDMNDFEFGDY